MTSPIVIRGLEQWNRWSPDHSPLLIPEESREETGRVQTAGIRLRPMIKYGFIILALGLLLMDSFRLAFSANATPVASHKTQVVRSARTVHAVSPTPKTNSKRHSGV